MPVPVAQSWCPVDVPRSADRTNGPVHRTGRDVETGGSGHQEWTNGPPSGEDQLLAGLDVDATIDQPTVCQRPERGL